MSRLGKHVQAGFGLIELMIAMVLGLLVLGAAIAVFQSNNRTFNANEGQNRVQEGARAAFEMMSRDIRAAGGTSCSKLARPDEERTYTTEETDLIVNPITGGANEFTVVSGDDSGYQIENATTTTVVLRPGPTGWLPSDGFKTGDRVVLCNATLMYVVTLDAVTDATRTLGFSTNPTPVPIYEPGVAPPATVSAARYRSARWFLNNGSLSVNRNGVTDAVVPGVTALNVSYLQRGGTGYTTTPTWADVVAVRVNMTLRGQGTVGGDVQVDGNNVITRNTSNVAAIRGRAP